MELKNFFAQDDQGNALADADCYVYMRGTESLVNGLQAANGVPLGNPFVSDGQGLIQFAAANGVYDVRVVKEKRDYRIRTQFNDVSETVATVEAAASRAEVARDAAQLSTGIFANIAAGLASTAHGSYFSTPSTEASEYLVLYKNEGGAAVPIDSYPNTKALSEAASNIRQGPSNEVIFDVSDESGFSKFIVKADDSFGTERAAFGPNSVSNDNFDIGPSVSGSRFGVADEQGFYAVYAGEGESVGETGSLHYRLEMLNSRIARTANLATSQTNYRRIIAHRGTTIGGVAPENSLDAFRMSARAGYRLVETDLVKTADGKFVIMHDYTINRTCRSAVDYSEIPGVVSAVNVTLETLRSSYVLASNKPRQRRKIPTLNEFLITCRDLGLYPLIEVKNSFSNDDIGIVASEAVSVLGVNGFAITSFNINGLDHVRSLYAGIELYYIYDAVNSAVIDHMVAMQPAVLYVSYEKFTAENVAEARNKGVKVAGWLIPNGQLNSMMKLGLDEFATDTIAPELNSANVIFRDHSDESFTSYTTTGNVTDGVLLLAEGQTLTFLSRAELVVPFGAYHLTLDVLGIASISGNRVAGSVGNSSGDFVTYIAHGLLCNESATFTITAGAGGCSIKDVSFAIAKN